MNAQPILALHFDSSTLPAGQQFAAQQKFMKSFVISTAEPERGFFARSTAWVVGTVMISLSRLGPLDIERSSKFIRHDSADHYVAAVVLEGAVWEGNFDGKEVRVEPGEICMLDMTRPMRTSAEAGTTITVMLPRQFLDEMMPPYDIHGLVLDAPAGHLLTDFLVALTTRLPSLSLEEGPAVARGTRDLIAATLATARNRAPVPDSTSVLLRAKRHISQNLERDLSAETISKALAVSRSTLFRTFEPMGGLEGFVRGRRLARAHELLSKVERPLTISAIAFAVGFKSVAHFSRAFKETYGYTARDLQTGRSTSRALAAFAGSDAHKIYESWTESLL